MEELDAVVIGRVTDDAHLRVKANGSVVADIPNAALTDAAPLYRRPISKPIADAAIEITASAMGLLIEASIEELDSTFMRIVAHPAIDLGELGGTDLLCARAQGCDRRHDVQRG